MKTFDETEERIIKRLVSGEGYARNFINIFDSLHDLQSTRIRLDKTNNTAEFLFEIQGSDPTDEESMTGIEKQKYLTELLIKYLILFEFLEKEMLATFFDSVSIANNIVVFGMGAENMPYFQISISDINIVKLLAKYIHKEIIPSPSLRKLVNNNFRFDDDIKFNKQLYVAWAGVGLALLIGLYNGYNTNGNSQTQVKNQQSLLEALTQENRQSTNSVVTAITSTNAPITEYTTALNHVAEQLSKIATDIEMLKISINTAQEINHKHIVNTKKN